MELAPRVEHQTRRLRYDKLERTRVLMRRERCSSASFCWACISHQNADIRRCACICGSAQEEKIGQLLAFGFDSAAARAALEACGWDVEAAANRLLS